METTIHMKNKCNNNNNKKSKKQQQQQQKRNKKLVYHVTLLLLGGRGELEGGGFPPIPPFLLSAKTKPMIHMNKTIPTTTSIIRTTTANNKKRGKVTINLIALLLLSRVRGFSSVILCGGGLPPTAPPLSFLSFSSYN